MAGASEISFRDRVDSMVYQILNGPDDVRIREGLLRAARTPIGLCAVAVSTGRGGAVHVSTVSRGSNPGSMWTLRDIMLTFEGDVSSARAWQPDVASDMIVGARTQDGAADTFVFVPSVPESPVHRDEQARILRALGHLSTAVAAEDGFFNSRLLPMVVSLADDPATLFRFDPIISMAIRDR